MGSLEAARPGDGDGAVPGSRSFPETAKLRASPAWEKLGCPGSAGGSVQPPSAGWGARSPVLLEEGLREAAGHRDGAVRKTWGTVTEEMETFHLLKSLSWSYWHFGWLSAAWQRVQKVWCDTPIWTLPRHVDRVLLKSSSSNHRYLQGCLNFYLHRKFCNLVCEYISAVIVVLQFLVCWCIKMIHRMWLYMHVTLLDRPLKSELYNSSSPHLIVLKTCVMLLESNQDRVYLLFIWRGECVDYKLSWYSDFFFSRFAVIVLIWLEK